jgi:1,3-propanediol dehydrogenase/alcohol dehydrogenase
MSWKFFIPTKLVFGPGCLEELPSQVAGDKVLLVTGRYAMKNEGVTDRVKELLDAEVVVFDKVEPNPSHLTVDQGVLALMENNCEWIVALGGGSALDAAKMISVISTNGGECSEYFFTDEKKIPKRVGIPVTAVPTTSGTGSEITPFSVISDKEQKMKHGLSSRFLFPFAAVVDPELTVSMPQRVTASTGADALSHAIEAYWNGSGGALSDTLAIKAIHLVNNNLEKACEKPDDVDARSSMMYASTLAGMAITHGGVTAAHSLSHAVTAYHGIPHGNGCLIFVYALMDYYREDPRVMDTVIALGGDSIETGRQRLKQLMENIGLDTKLREVGMTSRTIQSISREVSRSSYLHQGPRDLDEHAIKDILMEML